MTDETPRTGEEPEEAPAAAETPAAETPAAEAPAAPPAPEPVAAEETDIEEDEDQDATPRVKPEIPGMDLEVDIVREGEEALREEDDDEFDEDADGDLEEDLTQPIADASIDLAAGARYAATGKRKSAVARVILRPGEGTYTINSRHLDEYFPRIRLQRMARQPLEAAGYQNRMDVVARIHGGGVAAQASALRHGVARALVEADPALRGELKRRGYLTRDPRVKERKKAGLKKARKRPQFSKR